MPVGDGSILEYVRNIVPETALIQYVFYEDFNGDGENEAIVVYSTYAESGINTCVFYAEWIKDSYKHRWLVPGETTENYGNHSISDAYAVDLTGDGRTELVLVFVKATTTYLNIYHWIQGAPKLTFVSDEFYHGLVEVIDEDRDGACEIILQEETVGEEQQIISSGGYLPHVCESHIFKWNGKTYSRSSYPVEEKNSAAYNTAAKFFLSIWKGDYETAYNLAYLPAFLGVEYLSQNTWEAFRAFVDQNIKPVLMENLELGLLEIGPYPSFYNTSFQGQRHDFRFNFVKEKRLIKVSAVTITPKEPGDVVKMFFDALEQEKIETALKFCLPNFKRDNIVQLIEAHKGDAGKGGNLRIQNKSQDANRAIMYTCYANLPEGYFSYVPPNRGTSIVLEKYQDYWLIKYVKYLGDILSTEVVWEQRNHHRLEYNDGIYPTYKMEFKKPTYIVIKTHDEISHEHNGQFSVPDCGALHIINIFNGVGLSIYSINDKGEKAGFISTDVRKVYVSKISEVAYFIHIIMDKEK